MPKQRAKPQTTKLTPKKQQSLRSTLLCQVKGILKEQTPGGVELLNAINVVNPGTPVSQLIRVIDSLLYARDC